MGKFIEEPTELQISKLNCISIEKNQKYILVMPLNLKNLYMRFLTAQLKRTLKKIIDIKDTQKCTKYQKI